MQFSLKQKVFCQCFSAFSKCILAFEHFLKKMTLIADELLKLRTSKNMVRNMSKNSPFREPFETRHGKPTQSLLQSERQHPYHI